MTREQTEAKVLSTVSSLKLTDGGPYCLPENLLLEIVYFAWAAGQNYGTRRGGELVLAQFDAALGGQK